MTTTTHRTVLQTAALATTILATLFVRGTHAAGKLSVGRPGSSTTASGRRSSSDGNDTEPPSLCPQAVPIDKSPIDLEAEAGAVAEVKVTIRMLAEEAISQRVSLRPTV